MHTDSEPIDFFKAISDLRTQVSDMNTRFTTMQNEYIGTIKKLVLACEYRDKLIEKHVTRISKYTAFMATKIGMSQQDIDEITAAAPMHDIGKIGVSEEILLKPGKLTGQEFAQMKMHTIIGGNLLSHQDSSLLRKAREIALYHHENWDGTGYPIGLKADQIPLAGRMVNLMDSFDALTSTRPHKMAYSFNYACDKIHEQKEKKFDPDLVDMLDDNLDAFIKIKAEVDTPAHFPESEFSLSERDVLF